MMSFGNYVVADQSRPRGIRRYPFVSEKVTKIERCTSVSVQLSEGFGWARMGVPPRGRVLPRRGHVSGRTPTQIYNSGFSVSGMRFSRQSYVSAGHYFAEIHPTCF